VFRQNPMLTAVTFVYLGVVGFITLVPQQRTEGSDWLLWAVLDFFSRHSLTDWISYSVLEFWSNVLMFIPVGLFFLLLLGRRRWWLAVLLGVVLTCGIEFAQLFIPTRVSDPRDILANSTGAFIGVLAALVATWPAAVRAARQRRLAARPA
jgi:glycopeptide antibiotics resistance protein